MEMQDDFASFFAGLDKMQLKEVKVASFASSDKEYPHFCGSTDIIVKRAKELGAAIITESLKLEGDGTYAGEEIESNLSDILKAL
ncbi:MAG: flavodoxin domain-containing protein [Desulfovibrio sp.]|nr:flavodoxin domain-containing protein [Desulfovibrio sp.]